MQKLTATEKRKRAVARAARRMSVESVKREMRNAGRRKGGDNRLRFEVLLDKAWRLAWDDMFQGEPAEYFARAIAMLEQEEKSMGEYVDKMLAEAGYAT